MSRYKGPRLRIVRRLGKLPGLTSKVTNRNSLPGQHGTSQKKTSQYGIRLQEKQKLRYNYGINERQLIKYVRQARKLKGSTGEVLLQLLEMRLDNIIFRLGFAPTIAAARQAITHGHFLVNSQRVNIPSYQCKPNEKITISTRQSSRNLINTLIKDSSNLTIPPHLTLDKQNNIGIVNSIINRQFIGLELNELLVVEFYSRKV
jgi:small subunit ribosomal protein S4